VNLGISKPLPILLVLRWSHFAALTGTSWAILYFLAKSHTLIARVASKPARMFYTPVPSVHNIDKRSVGVADQPSGVPTFIDVHPNFDDTRKAFKGWAGRVLTRTFGHSHLVYF
jgi:hypothetical protein